MNKNNMIRIILPVNQLNPEDVARTIVVLTSYEKQFGQADPALPSSYVIVTWATLLDTFSVITWPTFSITANF